MKKGKYKIFLKGLCFGIVIAILLKYGYQKFDDIEKKKKFIDAFDVPKVTNDVKFKKKVVEKKYIIDYYGENVTFQDENLKVYGFDATSGIYEENLENVVVEKPNTNIDLNNYISEEEFTIYNAIQYKDLIDTQYKIFSLFVKMRELSEELLKRGNVSDRIDYLYNVCLLYMEPDSYYTIGNLKFSELNSTIQNDIKKEVIKIKYIVDNGNIKSETNSEKFTNNFTKVLKYNVLNLGK